MTNMAVGKTVGRDKGRKISIKYGRLKKKTTSLFITTGTQQTSLQLKRPLTREKLCRATEVDNVHL